MSIASFSDWLNTPQGSYVLAWERARHDELVADIFGYNSVQIGLPQIDHLRNNRMLLRFYCDSRNANVQVVSNIHHLPFAANSIDLAVLPHALEFDDEPHQILREVERVLVPEGSVIITGFNPFSLWGLRRKFMRQRELPPWRGNYISVPRLKDWFRLLGLEPKSGAFGCYAPPVAQPLRHWRWMDLAGDRWWPFAGAVYVIQAVKRVAGMRLIQPNLKTRLAAVRAPLQVSGARHQGPAKAAHPSPFSPSQPND